MPSSPNSGTRCAAASASGAKRSWFGREQLGSEVERDSPPGCARAHFPAADDQAAGFGLEVDAGIGITERRQVARHLVGLLGDHVLVLDRVHGEVDAGQARGLGAPHAGRVDEGVALDSAQGRLHRDHPPPVPLDCLDPAVGDDPHAGRPGAGGERVGELTRVDVAVTRHPGRAVHAGRVQQREQLDRLGRRHQRRRRSRSSCRWWRCA